MTALDSLFGPPGMAGFRDEVYGRTYRVFTGDGDRFENLFGWNALNEVLSAHRLDSLSLQLMREGMLVPEDTYSTSTVWSRRSWQRVRPAAVLANLRDGATLRLREVQNLSKPVRELASTLERELRERVQVNAYATVHDVPGTELHWDDHDVLILQVSGSKRWSLHGQREPKPYAGEYLDLDRPAGDPVADIVLQQGEALYLPRGWWHLVRASAGPSLHLTFGIYRPTGVDLLDWLTRRLRAHDMFRADLPHWSDEAAQQEYAAAVSELVVAALAEPRLVEQLYAERDAAADLEPGYLLPYAAMTEPALLPDGATRLRLTARRSVVELDGDQLVLRAGGETWRYPVGLAPVLTLLAGGRSATITDLVSTGSGAMAAGEVEQALADLLRAGLVTAEQHQSGG